MIDIHNLAALGAAACWAVTGVLNTGPAGRLGAFAFTRIRMGLVLAMLVAWVLATGSWRGFSPDWLPAAVLSGVIGIFLGDTALFATLNRMGPRRTAILFALNAPIAVLIGWSLLGERLDARQALGVALAFTGVVIAIAFGRRPAETDRWETIRGSLPVGIALGLLAAAAQAVGSIIARPMMMAGADAATASGLRVGIAVLCFWAIYPIAPARMRAQTALTPGLVALTALSGFLAMALGMTLVLFALEGGEVGVVSTLSATTPALILPILWLVSRQRPSPQAWAGAGLTVAGCALLFLEW